MSSLAQQLETSRQSLLDLSTRNRLLSIPRKSKSAKVIEVVDELSAEIHRILVKEGKTMTFLPGREIKKTEAAADQPLLPGKEEESDEDFGELPQPEDDSVDERGIARRHSDLRLQTLLTSEGLQKRLLTLFYDARTFEEEQGVNILYLAIGMLKWFEADNSDIERYAPLLLVPVTLERGSAAEKFKLRWQGDEPAVNLSLQAKMKADFGIIIPDLPEEEDFDITAYFKSVRDAVNGSKRFEVLDNDMVLGFFSFAKFLMYRDLDPALWPESAKLDRHPLIVGLMQNGFSVVEGMIGEDANIDEHLPPERIFHVVDADSSQTLAIEEVRRGRNLVIQGPPGTGKSQTITNIIASAVADGKKVLFVAEKMAALEVVQRRMGNIGLGPLCLELHSNKSNKRAVLEELKKTRDLGRPRSGHDGDATVTRLKHLRSVLNSHAGLIHTPHSPSGLTAYQIIGNMVKLKQEGADARGIVLEKPQDWAPQDRQERQHALADITARMKEIGTPALHPWRGVNRPQLLPTEYDRLCEALAALRDSFDRTIVDVEIVEAAFASPPQTLHTLEAAQVRAKLVSQMPQADWKAFNDPAWQNSLSTLQEIIETGNTYKTLKEKIAPQVMEAAWTANLADCRQQIAMHGESFLRIFQAGYRQSIALLKSILSGPLPKPHSERLALVDDILSLQRMEKFFKEHESAAAFAFGHLWQGTRSDWAKLTGIIEWRKAIPTEEIIQNFMSKCAALPEPASLNKTSASLNKEVPDFFLQTTAVFDLLRLDIGQAFNGVTTIGDIDRNLFQKHLAVWIDRTEEISKWINFKSRFDQLTAHGMMAIAQKLWKGEIAPETAQKIFDRAYFDAMTEIVFTQHPSLREFDGEQQQSVVYNFRENDKSRIEQARIDLRSKHFNDMPRSEGGIGPLGVLNGEFAKKRNHLSIRKLLRQAGHAVQALKPVFMMSPLSVAQFLEAGSLQFDLLVMDEASQVEPVDALGAIARVQQIVVVGDTRQLPPTRFFARMTGNAADNDNEDDAEPVLATQDVESILNLCLARGLPQRMLRWHYRSKHQSLIAVSNREFYDNKLFIVPSPYDAASGMGLKFHYLPDAFFDSGETSVNPVEAKTVAQAVVQHARNNPNLSLGVGTFSMKQKQAILDELEILRRKHPEIDPFFTQSHQDEPFFVKNLENIQGDERDVIFISVAYGKNRSGYMAMRFGPLSADGGERRLNVLISRAKRRCEVFTSITADDIDLERGKGAGVASLKLFLKFAQTGKLDFGKVTEKEPDSIFEEQVAAALRVHGFEVKTQIGIAGFFVDVAIVDTETPGRFILGVECDGAAYHSSRSARDRDRLRQAVLEDHGWIIHRIWSTDWFRRPKEQLDKLVAAIHQARETLRERGEQEKQTPKATFEIISTEDATVVQVGEKKLSAPYQEASFPVALHMEPHEIGDSEMVGVVTKIVDIESPIHLNEVITRVRTLWNLARAGARIQSKVKTALKQAVRKGLMAAEGEFYLKPGADMIIRNRSVVSTLSLRKVEHLPPQEIRKAIVTLIEANFGARPSQIATEVGTLLGFKSTSAQLKEYIDNEVQFLLSNGTLLLNDDHLQLSEARQRA